MRNGWDKITLYKFQQIDAINARQEVSDMDKVLFSVCVVFDMTEYELDNTPIGKVNKMMAKVTKIFQSPFNAEPKSRLGKYFIKYDVGAMSFGQYIELSHYLTNSVQNAHKAMASISNKWLRENNADEHTEKANYFLTVPIGKINGCIALITKNLASLTAQYKDLFGLDTVVHAATPPADPFIKRYGWMYAASQIADYEKITLEQAYKLNVRQAFHDLTFLKARSRFEVEQTKKK